MKNIIRKFKILKKLIAISILIIFTFANCSKVENSQDSTQVIEVAVFKIKEDQIKNITDIQEVVDAFFYEQEGAISIQHLQDEKDPLIFIDICKWKNSKYASLAAQASENDISLAPFFEATEKLIHFGNNKLVESTLMDRK